MGYEDRDYFRSEPGFRFSAKMPTGTRGLLIAVVAGYLIGLFVGNTVSFVDPDFWAALAADPPDAQPLWARRLFVLTAADIAPWADGYAPGYWKLLTHWLVAPSLLSAVVSAIVVYLVGRSIEPLFGTGRFLLLFAAACLLSALLAGLLDPLILPGREQIVIMGPSAGIIAAIATLIWIAPNQRSIFGWPLKKVVIGLVGVLVVLHFLMPYLGSSTYSLSPTQYAWAVVLSAVYMSALKARGELPSLASAAPSGEPWSSEAPDPEARKREKLEKKGRELLEKKQAEAKAERERLDAILDKISKEGVGSLSRSEKKFLDSQSRKKG